MQAFGKLDDCALQFVKTLCNRMMLTEVTRQIILPTTNLKHHEITKNCDVTQCPCVVHLFPLVQSYRGNADQSRMLSGLFMDFAHSGRCTGGLAGHKHRVITNTGLTSLLGQSERWVQHCFEKRGSGVFPGRLLRVGWAGKNKRHTQLWLT